MIFHTFLQDGNGDMIRYIVDDVAKTKRKTKQLPFPEWIGLPYRSSVTVGSAIFGNPAWALGLMDITEMPVRGQKLPRVTAPAQREFDSASWTG